MVISIRVGAAVQDGRSGPEVEHAEDLVVAARSDGDEVRETAVLAEAERAVQMQRVGVVAAGIESEDLLRGVVNKALVAAAKALTAKNGS